MILIVLVEIPQPQRPAADKRHIGYQRPVVILDLRPQLGGQARRADGARVPGIGRFGARALQGILCGCGEFRAACLERALAIGGDQALHGFDQRRQRRFGVGGDRQVDFGIALEVLIVAAQEQIARGDADQLRSGLGDRLRGALELIAVRMTVPQKSVSSRPRITSALPTSARLRSV